MNRVIITTGYMGSGSSAATDLIAEFKDCRNDYASYEYVLNHCPNGLFDLEDKLLLGNNAIRSDEAIRSFQSCMDKLFDKKYWWVGHYKDIIGEDFANITKQYIASITQFEYDGYWYYHEDADFKMVLKLTLQKPFKMLFHKFHYFKKITKYDQRLHISFIQKEAFYQHSKTYLSKVISLISKDAQNVVLDQFILPFNMHRIDHYFNDDTYAIIVDRDPRDVFVLNKYIWAKKNISIPMPFDVHQFCSFYDGMRKSEHPSDSKKILRIHFEDMIYQYEDTLLRIRNHLHFSEEEHVGKGTRLKPEVSIQNTQLFRKAEYAEEIAVIEQQLAVYLYDFPYQINNDVSKTIEFD